MTQAALAKKSGMTQAWLCRVEGGLRQPDIVTLRKLARALNVSLDYLDGHKTKRT